MSAHETTHATISRLTTERDAAMRMSDQWRRLCEQATAALKGADAEIARLRAELATLSGGLVLKGWWCVCNMFNGEEHSTRTECRSCGKAKTVRT